MADFKAKLMNANKETVKKCAIAGIVITAIVIFIFAMSVSDAKKFGEKDICTFATAITATNNIEGRMYSQRIRVGGLSCKDL